MKNVIKKKKMRSKKKSFFTEPLMYRCVDSVSNDNRLNKTTMDTETNVEETIQLYEGMLSKYTNIMKGWQFRWFILDPKTGILSYFISKTDRLKQPKGWAYLESAVILPSEEDSNTFTVNSSYGGICLKLRARDSKSRQEWINRLRAVSQLHKNGQSFQQVALISQESNAWSTFAGVKEQLLNTEKYHLLLTRTIDELPSSGKLQHLDHDLLVLKALSYAAIVSLNQCCFILQQQPLDFVGDKVNGFTPKHDDCNT